jgi:hypothetical protein
MKCGSFFFFLQRCKYQESTERGLDADGGPLLPDGHEVPRRGAGDRGDGGGERVGGGGNRGGVVGGLRRRRAVAAASRAAPQGAVVAG